jgi:hypothetical protein
MRHHIKEAEEQQVEEEEAGVGRCLQAVSAAGAAGAVADAEAASEAAAEAAAAAAAAAA